MESRYDQIASRGAQPSRPPPADQHSTHILIRDEAPSAPRDGAFIASEDEEADHRGNGSEGNQSDNLLDDSRNHDDDSHSQRVVNRIFQNRANQDRQINSTVNLLAPNPTGSTSNQPRERAQSNFTFRLDLESGTLQQRNPAANEDNAALRDELNNLMDSIN